MNREIWQLWWKRYRLTWVVYFPNALAGNVLLERVTGLAAVPLAGACLAADVAIWVLMSWCLRGWPR